MKKAVALLLALVMVFALCACGSSKAEEAKRLEEEAIAVKKEKAEEIYTILKDAYALTDSMGKGIYNVWQYTTTAKQNIMIEDGVAELTKQTDLSENEIKIGLTVEFSLASQGNSNNFEAAKELIGKWSEEDGIATLGAMDAKDVNNLFLIVNPLTNFCVCSCRNAYYINGRYDDIDAKLENVKQLLKAFKEEYPEFEGNEDMENMYVTAVSYFSWCQELSGSVLSANSVLEEYRNSVKASMAALDLII